MTDLYRTEQTQLQENGEWQSTHAAPSGWFLASTGAKVSTFVFRLGETDDLYPFFRGRSPAACPDAKARFKPANGKVLLEPLVQTNIER